MNSIFSKNVVDIILKKMEQEAFIIDEEDREIRDSKEIKKAMKEFKELLLKDVLSLEDFKVGYDEFGKEYTAITLMGKELWVPRKLFLVLVELARKFEAKNGYMKQV